MRKLLAASLLVLPLGLGCQHTGGICDCAPVPGDSTGYNAHVTYHATCPGVDDGAKAAPVPTKPVSTSGPGSFEPIGPPNPMPSGKTKL
ncbi:MAG TPA: hypothetical protein VHR66_27695 [Gemmataceae bacterium]|jgi:hypothetical protein|nr:hypothetical protein [Gemmataceae bacterium]